MTFVEARARHPRMMAALAALLLVLLSGALVARSATGVEARSAGAATALHPADSTPTATDTAAATVTPTATVALPVGATSASVPQVSAVEAELYNATTGKTLYSLDANHEMPMASTTKIMTAIVALTYGRLDQQITVGPDTVAIENQGTSIAGLRLGETLTLRELLYCLLLPSGDDAAIAIADGVGGSQDGFVALMNLEARLLGLSHTHYANPHGLDQAGHYTTASDLVRLTEYAMRSPQFMQIVDTPAITLPANATHHTFTLVNTNDLLPTMPFAYNGAIGVKTGFTGGAGYCLVFMAQRAPDVLIGVVLGEQTYDGRFTDATSLLNWGFTQVQPQAVAATPAATAGAATATP